MNQKQYDYMMSRLDTIENKINSIDGSGGCVMWIVIMILLGMIFS